MVRKAKLKHESKIKGYKNTANMLQSIPDLGLYRGADYLPHAHTQPG